MAQPWQARHCATVEGVLHGSLQTVDNVMRHPGQAAPIVRGTLFESDAIQIGSFVANPVSDACGDVERQSQYVVVLPFAGVYLPLAMSNSGGAAGLINGAVRTGACTHKSGASNVGH